MEVVASLSQGRTAAAQCGLFTHKGVPVIFEPPCINIKSVNFVGSNYIPYIRNVRLSDLLRRVDMSLSNRRQTFRTYSFSVISKRRKPLTQKHDVVCQETVIPHYTSAKNLETRICNIK